MGVAVLATLGGPVLAGENQYINVSRGFAISGSRERVAMVAKVTNSTAGAGLGLGVGFGKEGATDSVQVIFTQTGAKSRGLKVEGYSGEFSAVEGKNCTYEYRLSCDRSDVEWAEGNRYKVSFARGAKNAKGWLWTVTVRDLKARKSTKLTSFRAPFDKLATTSMNAVYVYANPDSCSDVGPVTAVVKKPAGKGSDVSWSDVSKHSSCKGATTAAPLVKGATKLKIS